MQVILQEDVTSLGKVGDVVDVKDGYARNYLIPNKKAVFADSRNVKKLEHQKQVVAAKKQKMKKGAEALLEKLKKMTITIERESNEEEKIFGSVTNKDVAEMLRKEGVVIDRHLIQIDSPIKNIGVYDIPVKVHSEVTGTVKVWVVKK